MDMQFYPALCNGCNCFYIEGLKLTRVNKRAPGSKYVSELVDVSIGVRQVDVNKLIIIRTSKLQDILPSNLHYCQVFINIKGKMYDH